MDNNALDTGEGVLLETVDKFCYLRDLLDADAGCDSVLTTRVRIAWKQFCEYLPILTRKGLYLKLHMPSSKTCHSGPM